MLYATGDVLEDPRDQKDFDVDSLVNFLNISRGKIWKIALSVFKLSKKYSLVLVH